jgi:hypothetical protein
MIASTMRSAHSSGVCWSQSSTSPAYCSRSASLATSSMSVSIAPVTTCSVLTGVSCSSRRSVYARLVLNAIC